MRPTRMIPDFAQLVRTRMSVDAVEGLGTSSGRAGSADHEVGFDRVGLLCRPVVPGVRGLSRQGMMSAGPHTGTVLSKGTVREWSEDHGIGVIDSPDTPGGCWVHFSQIVTDGAASLTPGDRVTFTHEALLQDEFSYRAVLVWPPGVKLGIPPRARRQEGPSTAYRSGLTIRWSNGTVTEGIPGK